nr:MAG: putative RNA dependent RNA polymerase [Inner Mongolia sediment mitovirus 5]
MSRNLFITIKKISQLLFSSLNTIIYIKPYFKLVTKMLRHNGTVYTVKHLKQMRLHITRYLCGQPLLVNNLRVGLDKNGWPKALLFLKPLLDQGIQGKKFLLTLISLSRTLEVRKGEKLTPDYTSITNPGPSNQYTIPNWVIKDFVAEFNLESDKPKFSMSDIYLSLKGSPSGKSSLTSPWSILRLGYNQMQWIYDLTDSSGVDYFNRCYTWSFNNFKQLINIRKNSANIQFEYNGALAFIKDPECKLRIIAMLDYTSQLFLKPVHRILFNCLKKIPMDRTFTQNPKNSWNDNDQKFWSLDLSSATDRFPIHLQRRLIREIFSDERFASSWANLLTKREFLTPEGQTVMYAVGQPMGAYSSWAAFTLSHHLVVYFCSKLALKPNFDQYMILGDDIVIKDDLVSKYYMKVMKELGVELSPAKTHVSFNTYEFAKRWFQDGKEITGLPMRGLVKNLANPFIVYTILYDFFKIKGNVYTYSGNLVSLVKLFYRGLKFWNGKRNIYLSLNFVPRLELFTYGLDIAFGFVTEQTSRRLLCLATATNELYPIPSGEIILREIRRVFSLGISKQVTDTFAKTYKSFDSLKDNISFYGTKDVNDLRFTSVFWGFYNHLESVLNVAQDWDDSNITLTQAAENLVQMDISSVFSKDRSKWLSLVNIGKAAQIGFDHLNKQTNIMYGSSVTESTFTGVNSIYKGIESTTSVVMMDMKRISKGEYASYINYYTYFR